MNSEHLDPKHCSVMGEHKTHVWFTAVQRRDNPGHIEVMAMHCRGTRLPEPEPS